MDEVTVESVSAMPDEGLSDYIKVNKIETKAKTRNGMIDAIVKSLDNIKEVSSDETKDEDKDGEEESLIVCREANRFFRMSSFC